MVTPDPAIPRWLRTLPWLLGLLIGASAHLWWWSHHGSPIGSDAPSDPSATVHVHVHHEPTTEAAPAAVEAPSTSAECPTQQRPSAAVLCTDEGCTIRRDFLQRLRHDPSVLSVNTRLVPYVAADGSRHTKLFGIRPGSLADLLGLRNGDVILEVNGASMGDPLELARLPASVDRSDHLFVTLRRKGVRHTMHYAIADE